MESVESGPLPPAPDLCGVDVYDVPDPGLLTEKNEPSFSEPVPQRFTSSSEWQSMTVCSRARQLWLLLRASLQSFVEKAKRAELRAARLTHGLEPLRRLAVAAGLCSVAQDPVGRRFVVLDGAGLLHLHREDGLAQEKLPAPITLTGLVAVLGPLGAVGRFVGWGPAGLAILRSDLSLLWLSKPGLFRAPGHEPICCLPVPNPGLLLVAAAGGILALWKFRSGGRCLVPQGSPLQLPASPPGALVRLALGPQPPCHLPCCFAACGSAVLTCDLHTWALIDVRRDLHKTTVSDLAYCSELEAMVTASRDSTVKVWEADWQIRMVFVGHSGPVTAVAVLPNTSLVLSASQDGTLRTWDLQAAAQVGEVALSCWDRSVPPESVSRLLAPAGPGWPLLSLRASSVELWCLRELYSPLAQLSAPVLHLQVVPVLPTLAPPAPQLPVRLVCACADGSVSLVSALTGRVVNALLLEPEDRAAAVAYCLQREVLWLLTRTGHLLCANSARCPMQVLHRLRPPLPPTPRPCCLHLYSHLTDPRSAFASWEIVCQHKGDLCHRDMAWTWKDKNRWVPQPARAGRGDRATQQARVARRYLPVVGHTDGTLSVLELRSSKTVFRTEAHSPGPVTAIASTWNSVVSSGGDLTVKMWRVFPYAEESLGLLRTFSCCHPAVALCALGSRVTVGFEDPDSATYGLVQYGLGNSPRCDHRPQDDPTDHITGLCCCPALKLYACSSLDCTIRIWTAENRLLRAPAAPASARFSHLCPLRSPQPSLLPPLPCCCLCLLLQGARLDSCPEHLSRLLQLNGAPQALTFCSNSGDLVLALGSRLCLVSHRLYLPTSYLVKKLCQETPDEVHGPPLTNKESLASAQPQRLANLHGVAGLSMASSFIHRQTATPQQPVLEEVGWVLPLACPLPPAPCLCPCPGHSPSVPGAGLGHPWLSGQHTARLKEEWAHPRPPPQDLQALIARDHDLQQLGLGLVGPAARPPPSWQQRQEAFDNYLRLIYGPDLLGTCSGRESQRWSTTTVTVERDTRDACALPGPSQAGVCAEAPTVPTVLPPQDLGTQGRRFARPPRVTLPIPPTHRRVHSRASQLLARSSLSSDLGLSLDLQLQSEPLLGEKPVAPDPPSYLQHRIPLLPKRRPQALLSNLGGFYPATIQPDKDSRRPIHFPGCVPNSVVLQQMWQPGQVGGLKALCQLMGSRPKVGHSRDDLGLRQGGWRHHAKWQQNLLQWLGDAEEQGELVLDLASDSLSPHGQPSDQLLESREQEAEVGRQGAVAGPQELLGEEGSAAVATPLPHQSSRFLLRKPSGSPDTTIRKESYFCRPQYRHRRSLWGERYGHLPRFLHFLIGQNWFKKLFPIFTLEAYPEVGTVEGLASLFLDLLEEASWADRGHILHALLRLLPDVSQDLCSRLQGVLLCLLNRDQPPSLEVSPESRAPPGSGLRHQAELPPTPQDPTQKQFVMLALQLLLACSLDAREVVLELSAYFLYSPAPCRPEIQKLMDGLGLQDPQGFLFQEMTTWVRAPDLGSKAALRERCRQKLEEMMQPLQVRAGSAGGAPARRASRRRLPRLSPWAEERAEPGEASRLLAPALALPPGLSPTPQLPVCHRRESGGVVSGWRGGSTSPASLRGGGGRGRFHPGQDTPSPGSLPQTEAWQPSVAKLSEMLPKIALPPPKGAPPPMSMLSGTTAHVSVTPSVHSGTPSSISWTPARVVSPGELDSAAPEAQAQQMRPQRSSGRSRRALSETLVHFRPFPEVHPWSSAPAALLDEPLPLEQTDWSRSKMLDLGPIDALNFFCEQQRARQQGVLQGEFERPRRPPRLHPRGPNTVVPQPRDRRHYPILRLQEAQVQRPPVKVRGHVLSRLWEDHTLDSPARMLKLPLPRVEPQPFPRDWPRPSRPLPPGLLQPALQRYFLLDGAHPDSYS
ncbi:WD repeat-containing protein 97 isoform X5 [Phacochoerus africanus]|uniref:WD repeat-containing protein 97 isoform X5 n=1 Tax=Phacochoerus africanus TaxID=41426 RepID=UPI001FD97436|nr:WD repeat-containing protein 97 isoform X5 [Phacochoerus africanus]